MSSDNHEYDGIKELDNPLPNWWLVTFFGTIIFSFLYYIHYMSGSGDTLAQEFQKQIQELPQAREKAWTENELVAPFNSPENLASGQAIFISKCFVCHGNEGEGTIGPNLTDNFWISGDGKRADITQVIQKGVVTNGMPAWSGVLGEKEVIEVAAFVYSLKGTQPLNPKAPQGHEVKSE